MTARPDFAVVTGLSGAGKSQAAKVFEDLGYYILDNLPPALMASALDVARKGGHPRVAMVVDARSGALFADAAAQIERLDRAGNRPHVLFFDASDEVLLRRYSETRHRHPLERSGGVQPSIEEERRLLVDLRSRADKVIDTTHLSVKDLRDTLHSLYGEGTAGMLVQVMSFGYKYGLPPSADLVLDVRFMENPFYIDRLRPLSGSDEPVREFVLGHNATRSFLDHLMPLLEFALPRYEDEKKAR
ncbi:MAG: RNase adapter RapZ, partial [Candidatus Acidiferrum sp.]